MQTRAKTEIMATTETTAAMRATMTRATTMRGARMAGEKVAYHCNNKKTKLWILCE